MPDGEIRLLCARIDDMINSAEKGSCGVSNFLSPREKHFSRVFLTERGMMQNAVFFGGCRGCERERLFVFPDYMIGDGCAELRDAELCEAVTAVRASSGGFGKRPLTHRDYLGACLGLGVTREKLGDISVYDGGALIFCDVKIAAYICETLTSVGSESARAEIDRQDPGFEIKREFENIGGTVASARIDCIVAELCNASREKAQSLIKSCLVEVEYEVCEKPDKVFGTPFTVSVRGYGKYIVQSASEPTKKGRFRLSALKFI